MTTPPTSACTGHNPEIWFVPGFPNDRHDAWATARAICTPCPARTQCLALALRIEDGLETRHGMWGGMSPEERSELVRQQRRTA